MPAPRPAAQDAPSGTQAIDRAIAVLRTLAAGELGVSEIATRLDLRVSTTHRIVRGLVDQGFVAQDLHTDRYRLGQAAILLGRAAGAQHGLDEVDLRLRGLADEFEATASFSVRGPVCALVLAAVTPDGSAPDSAPGAAASYHASAAGKALLAWSGVSTTEAVAGLDALDAFTERTISTPAELVAALDVVVERGHAFDDGESAAECRGVAAPVLDERAFARAAVSVVDQRGRLKPALLARAAKAAVSTASELAVVLPLEHY